jgi:hypothetical protein
VLLSTHYAEEQVAEAVGRQGQHEARRLPGVCAQAAADARQALRERAAGLRHLRQERHRRHEARRLFRYAAGAGMRRGAHHRGGAQFMNLLALLVQKYEY